MQLMGFNIMNKFQQFKSLTMQELNKQNICNNGHQIQKLFRNSNQYRLGAFVFKPNISQDQIRALVPQKSMKLINVNAAYRYCKQQMFTIRVLLSYITQWDHGILQLGSHNFKNFFTQFKQVSMKQLLVLNIENNNISSIELIQNLDAPNLDCIYMHGNPITTIKSMRKASFTKLTRLYVNVSDNQYLSEMNAQNLSLIQNSPRTAQQFQWRKFNSVRWVAKIQSLKLRRVLTGMSKYASKLDRPSLEALSRKNKCLTID